MGLTQWRVREGVFLSTVLHAEATSDVLDYLVDVPEGLLDALDHEALSSLEGVDRNALLEALLLESGPWLLRHVELDS